MVFGACLISAVLSASITLNVLFFLDLIKKEK